MASCPSSSLSYFISRFLLRHTSSFVRYLYSQVCDLFSFFSLYSYTHSSTFSTYTHRSFFSTLTTYSSPPPPSPSSGMDGLLRSEFALVLRDSLNSTPRRHIVSPPPPSLPSPPKKPRASGADFGIHCDMQLEPRLQYAPFPTSPTSPLPTSRTFESSPTVSSTANTAIHLVPPTTLVPFNSRPSQSLTDRSPISKPKHHNAVSSSTTRLTASLIATASPMARPLDMLATVSAEQSVKPELQVASDSKHSNAMSATNPPTSPVNSEPLTPLFSDDKKKIKARSSAKTSTTGRVFSCKMCSSTFSQQFNLNKHIRAVHERRRPFECETCHARFQQKSHRTMHHLAVHEKLRQFACDQCSASFSWRGVLKKHRKSIHGIDE